MSLSERIFNIVENKKRHPALISEWEQEFVDSIHKQVKNGRESLSPAQNSILQKIEAKLSEDAIAARNTWASTWSQEKQKVARMVAKYYLNAGYFTSVAQRVFDEPEWVMPEALYNKMCNNKYAKKVLNEADAQPKYEVGATVMLRSTTPSTLFSWPNRKKLFNTPLFIMGISKEIKNAVKGAKIYSVLPAGCPSTFEVEERYLKKYRQSKKKDKIIVDKEIPF